MVFRIALIAIAMQAGAWGDPSSLTWWVSSPLVKVKLLDPVPMQAAKTAELFAGRNEFEPFQIVLRGTTSEISNLDIEFCDFRTDAGAELPRSSVTAYLEQTLHITTPSTLDSTEGWWPDPLIPRVDRYVHEKRNAFPFSAQPGRNRLIWVDVFVPESAAQGEYTGCARLTRGGKEEFTVPIHLTVWAFVLPSTSTLRSSFGLNGITVLKQHRGKYTDDRELYALTKSYAEAALRHRISIHGGTMAPPKYHYDKSQIQLDWKAYDAEVEPFLNGSAIPKGEPLSGAKVTSVELRTAGSFASDDEQAAYMAAWFKHFDEKGWTDRLFLYLWDEPTAADYGKVLRRGQSAHGANAGIRNLVTLPYTPALEGVVNIWTPLVNCLVRKQAFGDFCAEAPPLDVYTKPIEQGRSLWIYQSCASHGCNIQGGPYFNGWPSYMIDAPATANRVMQWVAWKYGAEGELYFSMNEAYGSRNDPWVDVRLFGGNGDGTLFYPGRPDRIGGHTDIPIESIRLKLIREGLEDYEYLALLKKLAGGVAATKFVDRIVKEPYLWEPAPDRFLKVRRELGETLDRLASTAAIQGSNAH